MSAQPVRNYRWVAVAIVVATVVLSATVLSYSSFEATVTKTVSTTVTASPTIFVTPSTMTVNGSLYYYDDVSQNISLQIPGYAYLYNGSVTFLGTTFEFYCPPLIEGCPVQTGTTISTRAIVGEGTIRLSVTFLDGTTETIGGDIGPNPLFYIFTHDSNPQAGILIVSTSHGSAYGSFKAYLLLSATESGRNVHKVTFQETGDCSPPVYVLPWSVTLGNTTEVEPPNTPLPVPNGAYSAGPEPPSLYTITFSVPNGVYRYTVRPQGAFASPNGTVTVSGSDVTVTLNGPIVFCTTSSGG